MAKGSKETKYTKTTVILDDNTRYKLMALSLILDGVDMKDIIVEGINLLYKYTIQHVKENVHDPELVNLLENLTDISKKTRESKISLKAVVESAEEKIKKSKVES